MKTAKTLAISLQIAVYVFMLLGHVPAAFQVAVLLALAIPVAIGTHSLYCGYIRTDKYTKLKASDRKALERRILQTEMECSSYDAELKQIILNEDPVCSGCGNVLFGDNKTYARKRVVPKDEAIGFVGLRGYEKDAFVEWTGPCCLPNKEATQIKAAVRHSCNRCGKEVNPHSSDLIRKPQADGTLSYTHLYRYSDCGG